MTISNQAIRASQVRDPRTVYHSQQDVDVIREQIVQDESMKRRFLLLGLTLATAGLVGAIALLVSTTRSLRALESTTIS